MPLTPVEQGLNDTNRRWHAASRSAPLAEVIDDVAHADGLPDLRDPDAAHPPPVVDVRGERDGAEGLA